MKFSKLHGVGNDFIIINGLIEKNHNWEKLAKEVCNRHFGVGADGMMFCSESKIADIKMNFYNADGSRAAMCGNGIRCFAKFIYDNSIIKKDEIDIETDNGIKKVRLNLNEKNEIEDLSVKLDKVEFKPSAIPCTLEKENILNENVEIEGEKIQFSSVLMGVPHTVVVVKDFNDYNIDKMGQLIENLNIFPKKTNVNFIKKVDENTIEIKTWERGAGRTLGCGTGSAAAAAIAKKLGIINNDEITTISDGGKLVVKVDSDYNITLIGRAELICDGEFKIKI